MNAIRRGLTGDEHLTVPEAAACLHVSEAKARRYFVNHDLLDIDRHGAETVLWCAVIACLKADRRPKRPRPHGPKGWVYFVQGEPGSPVKIGFATNPDDRLATLQTGSPVRLRILLAVPGHPKHERELHRFFRAHRVLGEWFAETSVLLDTIAAWSSTRGRVWASVPRKDAP